MSNVYKIERLIFWMGSHSAQEQLIFDKINKLKMNESAFKWHYQDEKQPKPVSRFVDVESAEELQNEIDFTQRQGMEPVVIFPHSDRTWAHELGEYYISFDPLFFDDDTINISKFIFNPSSELYESWAKAALENSKSDIVLDASNQLLIVSVADEFDRWLKSTVEWGQSLKEQLVTFSKANFKITANGWLENKSSPLIRYKDSKPLAYFGCLPEQLDVDIKEPGPNGWAMTIEEIFHAIFSKKANLVSASSPNTQKTDEGARFGKLILKTEPIETIAKPPKRFKELKDNHPEIANNIDQIYNFSTSNEIQGSLSQFINLIKQLKSESEKSATPNEAWIKIELINNETGDVRFCGIFDIADLPERVEEEGEGEISAYVHRDAVFITGYEIKLSLLD